jgi:exopolysaccharide biosynthesis polyprenyl glycosylphosphotransferase
LGIFVENAHYRAYLPLLVLGTALLIGAFANLGLYNGRMLLRRYQSLSIILKASTFWLVAYLCVSLVLKFSPPISRLFVVISFIVVLAVLFAWRTLASTALSAPPIRVRLQRRVALLGWNANASSLAAHLDDPGHALNLAGIIPLPQDPVPQNALGAIDDLERLLRENHIDLLIATRVDLRRLELKKIVEICERTYVEWKIVPAAFDIFMNGLRLQMIGRTPVLGVEELAITRLFNRTAKRIIDIIGATLGLLASAPIIAVLGVLVKRESPKGPVLFKQVRIGAHHETFTLYKLRSMQPDAALSDAEFQSTRRSDPRTLKIGRLMRRWNLDELPQFWNVLRGEMSLVGPRPERPHHVDQLSAAIAHYLPRHVVKPGMTGWAQVNGLRGDSSIELRVQYDIYYIEKWSLWLDVQIMLLTFVRWKNAY